ERAAADDDDGGGDRHLRPAALASLRDLPAHRRRIVAAELVHRGRSRKGVAMKILGRIVGLAAFAAFYLKLVLQANLRIAADVITPGLRIRPAFLKIPLRTRGDYDLLLLSNLISMTPGTLSFDVSPDRNFLYVHVMYADD